MKNKLFSMILLFTMTALAQSPAPQSTPDEKVVRSGQEIQVVQSPEDKAIETRIQKILIASELISNPIVTAKDGVVTLRGEIDDASKNKTVEKMAADTQGVVAVLNKLDVKKKELLDLTPARTEAQDIAQKFVAKLPYLLASIFVMAVFILLGFAMGKLGRTTASKKITNPLLIELISNLFALPVILLGLYFVLRISGLTGIAVTVLGGTGALGLIVGFAMKNILENYFSGLMLSLRNPYKAGDSIRVDKFEGVVQKLTTRGTVVIDSDGNHILIPNNTILANTITNFTANPTTRQKFLIQLNLIEDPQAVSSLMLEGIKSVKDVLSEPAPNVLLEQFSIDAMTFGIYFWIDTRKSSGAKMKSAVMIKIKDELTKNGIRFPNTTADIRYSNFSMNTGTLPTPRAKTDNVEAADTAADDHKVLNLAGQGRVIDQGENLLPKK